jgi:hypothetical protein
MKIVTSWESSSTHIHSASKDKAKKLLKEQCGQVGVKESLMDH